MIAGSDLGFVLLTTCVWFTRNALSSQSVILIASQLRFGTSCQFYHILYT